LKIPIKVNVELLLCPSHSQLQFFYPCDKEGTINVTVIHS